MKIYYKGPIEYSKFFVCPSKFELGIDQYLPYYKMVNSIV